MSQEHRRESGETHPTIAVDVVEPADVIILLVLISKMKAIGLKWERTKMSSRDAWRR
jgi:hypothetical protein